MSTHFKWVKSLHRITDISFQFCEYSLIWIIRLNGAKKHEKFEPRIQTFHTHARAYDFVFTVICFVIMPVICGGRMISWTLCDRVTAIPLTRTRTKLTRDLFDGNTYLSNDHSTRSHGRVRKTWGQCKKALDRPPSQASLGGQPYSHAGRVKNTRALSKTSRDSVQRRQMAVRLGPDERSRTSPMINEATSGTKACTGCKYWFLNNNVKL